MRYIVWLARLLVFVLVLMFALNNTGPVDVRFYGAHLLTDVPLIVVMLAVFVLGASFSLLMLVGSILRRGREVKRLQRELHRLRDDIRDINHATGKPLRSIQTAASPVTA